MKIVYSFLLLSIFASNLLFAGESLAEEIMAAVQRPLGLVHIEQGSAEFALELATLSPRCMVHLQLADEKAVQSARMEIYKSGLLNRRIYIDQGDLLRLLPIGHSCDLVVLPALTTSALTPALAREVKRILHPWYGVAIMPDGDGVPEFLNQISRSGRKHAGMQLVQAAPLAGSDDWNQWWHGPDNNCVSKDTAFSLPPTMQWTGKPFFSPTRIELPIISAGRLFTLWNGFEMDMGVGHPGFRDAPEGDGPVLMAQTVGSGVRLWMRRLSPAAWVQCARAILVGDGDRLLSADGNHLYELDAATGQELKSIELDTPEVKWMCLDNGRILIMGGNVTVNQGKRSLKNLLPFRSSGLHLMAVDRASFKTIWRVQREEGKDAFDPRSPAISGDRLFVCQAGDTAEAFSVVDGKQIWQVKAGFERPPEQKPSLYEWDVTSRHPVSGYAIGGAYVISGSEMKEAVIVSQDDGRRLWAQDTKGSRMMIPLYFNETIWSAKGNIDPLSGKCVAQQTFGKINVTRDGEGRDFSLKEPLDFSLVPEANVSGFKQFRLMTTSNSYTLGNCQPGGRYKLRINLLEPWLDKAGQRFMDIQINGQVMIKGLDVFSAAGGKSRALVQELDVQADLVGKIQVIVIATANSPDQTPILASLELDQNGILLALIPAAGTYAAVPGFSPYNGDSCGRKTMAPFLENIAFDPAEKLKSACSTGSFVANGLLWKFPSPCSGCFEWRGFLEQSSREVDLPSPPPRWQDSTTESIAPKVEPQGWLSYRGNVQRSSASDANVPDQVTLRWHRQPNQASTTEFRPHEVAMNAEYVPTPPLVADQRIIVANASGVVEAHSLSDGQLLWQSFTAGRIQSSPAIWRDRVVVGSTDGHLYAFSLNDGHQLWRFRVAPEAGRMMVYEQLGSRWPVLSSPIICGDKVLVSAGLVGMIDGIHAVCVDAVSGELLWERNDWTATESNDLISGGAQFAQAGDEVLYHGGMGPPIRMDINDGKARPAFMENSINLTKGWPGKWKTIQAFKEVWGNVKGQDIGSLSSSWMMYGGRRMWSDQLEGGTWRANIKLLGRDKQGQGRLPVIDVKYCSMLPSWDDDAIVFMNGGQGNSKNLSGITLISRKGLDQALEELMKGPSTDEILAIDKKGPSKNAMTVPPEMLSKVLDLHREDLFTWNKVLKYGESSMCVILGKNALLTITMNREQYWLWALSRDDGELLWQVALPGRPVQNGLALAADGSIVVSLIDSSLLMIGPASSENQK